MIARVDCTRSQKLRDLRVRSERIRCAGENVVLLQQVYSFGEIFIHL